MEGAMSESETPNPPAPTPPIADKPAKVRNTLRRQEPYPSRRSSAKLHLSRRTTMPAVAIPGAPEPRFAPIIVGRSGTEKSRSVFKSGAPDFPSRMMQSFTNLIILPDFSSMIWLNSAQHAIRTTTIPQHLFFKRQAAIFPFLVEGRHDFLRRPDLHDFTGLKVENRGGFRRRREHRNITSRWRRG